MSDSLTSPHVAVTLGFCTADITKDADFLANIKEKSTTDLEIIPKQGYTCLTKPYNEVIKEAKNNTIILCHNDINILTKGFDKIILDLFEKHPTYGIIGVVGSNAWNGGGWMGKFTWKGTGYCKPQPLGTLIQYNKYKPMGSIVPKWILFAPKFRDNDLVPACCCDGMFIAFRRDRIKEKFDECLHGFHFYDVMFGVDNLVEGVHIGITYKLDICHYSDGLLSQAWHEDHLYSKFKYGDKCWYIPLPFGGQQIILNYKGEKDLRLIKRNLKIK